jgi:biopolymer transport protein ExbD
VRRRRRLLAFRPLWVWPAAGVVVLGILFLFLFRPSGEDLEGPTDVQLPFAPNTPTIIDPEDPRFKFVSINQSGIVYSGINRTDLNQLETRIRGFKQRYGTSEFPVIVRADARVQFRHVWPVLQVLRACGLFGVTFRVVTDRERRIKSFVWCPLPVKENDPVRKGPVVMKVPKDGEETGIVVIDIGRNAIRVRGSPGERGWREHLKDLAAWDRLTRVVLVPSDDALHQQVIDVLDLCCQCGLRDVNLMEEF